MKNKKMLYILIPIVLLVWGVIIYKIAAPGSVGDNITGLQNNQFATTSTIENLNDTFSIHPNYRDPFLGKEAKKSILSENKVSNVVAVSNVIEKTVRSSISWPSIVYEGLIKNQKNNWF